MTELSQDWADNLAKVDVASHRPNNDYGENIYMIWSTEKVPDLGSKSVDSWYSEIELFNFQGTNEEMAASTNARNLFKTRYFVINTVLSAYIYI